MKLAILSSKMRLKKPKGNIHFGKMILAWMLVCIMILGNFNIAEANATKAMTVTIGEGGLDQSNLSKVVNISNLKSVVKVTSDTGIVTHNISGDNITLNANGGTPSRIVNNPTKYSKTVNNSLTSTVNSFATTNPYSDGEGYSSSGLVKSGNPVGNPSDGSYKYVTLTNVEYTTRTSHYHYYDKDDYGKVTEESGMSTSIGQVSHTTDDFYRGTINAEGGYAYDQKSTGNEWCEYCKNYRAGYITYFRNGTAKGNLFKLGTFTQKYSGTAYKTGVDNYYKYTVTIEYIDNNDPVLTLSNPGENSYFSKINMV